jgi:pteridine reductase
MRKSSDVRKVVLVTGGAVRLGRAIALELAGAGFDIALHYHSSPAEAEKTSRGILLTGARVETFRADLSRPPEARHLVARVLARMGRLDGLVGSAANFLHVPFEKTDARVWSRAMDLNARANFLLARQAARELRRRRGRIVLVSDLAARRAWRGYAAHVVSKAALEAVVRVLARELAPEVSVNGVAPGTILPPDRMAAAKVKRLVSEIPLGRIGTPEELAQTVRFFCEGPAFVTGQVLTVDGGRSLV